MAASATADTLLYKIGSGQLHVSVALEIASAVASDGVTAQRIKTLAHMYTDTNQERSLHRWLADLHGHSLQLYTIQMLLQPPGKLKPEEVLRKDVRPGPKRRHQRPRPQTTLPCHRNHHRRALGNKGGLIGAAIQC